MRDQGRHYERAFEAYLRAHRIPYVAVDEARRALVPAMARGDRGGTSDAGAGEGGTPDGDLKSFCLR